MAYVYRHIRLDKNVPFYIGICRNEKDTNFARAYSCNPYHRNKIWFRIYSKTKIEVEILFDNVSEEFAKAKEIEFISLYKRIIDGGTLANLTLGGDGVKGFKNPKLAERNKTGIWKGKKHTEETKIKMSQIGKSIIKDEKWRKNLSESMKGASAGVKNPRYKGVIYAYDLEGNFVKSFELMKDAAKWAGISLASIDRYIEGKRYPSHKGIVYTRKKRHQVEEILDDMPLSITPYEDIAACAMAMDCISDMDDALMSREDAVLIAEIRQMVLKIVHTGIKEIYDSNFYGEDE